MAKLKDTKCWEVAEQLELSMVLLNMLLNVFILNSVFLLENWQNLLKWSIYIPNDPAVLPISSYPKKYIHIFTKKYMRIVIAALCIIAKKWKLARYPSTLEWINTLWYNHTTKYYTAMWMNNQQLNKTINLMNLMLREKYTTYIL